MNKLVLHRVISAGTALIAVTGTQFAFAQVGSDPTMPSPAYVSAQAKAGGRDVSQLSGPANTHVLVVGADRRFAVIDGHVVRPGQSHNGAKLLSIGPTGAVWQTDSARETYSMSPSVQKKVLSGPGATTVAKKQKKQRNGEGQ